MGEQVAAGIFTSDLWIQKDLSLQMTDKNVSQIRTLKTAYWIEMIDYSIEYQDIRGHIAERLYGKQYNKFCKQPRPKDITLYIWDE